ncbi:MAG: LysM peptidoglycan-binding domain-containing protein [Flavobacteriales bacterium]|nr:LysM peptidoglycan-binding domain-containing protein [Flavobacteriales bacterium]
MWSERGIAGIDAQRNSVSIQDLRRWNHLHGDRIRAGQRLLLHHEVVPEPVTTTKEPDEAKAVPASPGATEYIYHTVQPGDTLWGIAQNYPGVSLDDLKRLNANMNFRHLTVGEKIKVGVEKAKTRAARSSLFSTIWSPLLMNLSR